MFPYPQQPPSLSPLRAESNISPDPVVFTASLASHSLPCVPRNAGPDPEQRRQQHRPSGPRRHHSAPSLLFLLPPQPLQHSLVPPEGHLLSASQHHKLFCTVPRALTVSPISPRKGHPEEHTFTQNRFTALLDPDQASQTLFLPRNGPERCILPSQSTITAAHASVTRRQPTPLTHSASYCQSL